MEAKPFNRVAFAALLGGATGIAFAPVLVRLSQLGPSATAFYRLLFALPVLWFWMLTERSRPSRFRRPSSARDFGLLAVAGLCFTGDLAVWHWSIKLTSVANATLFTNFATIFVTLGAWLMFKERITGQFMVGLVLALAGAIILLGNSLNLTHDHLVGDVLGLTTALFYAGYMLAVKQLRRSFSTATIMAWSGVAACAGLWVVAMLSGEALFAISARGWLVLFALAMVSQVAGQSLIAYGFGHLPASFSSLSLLLQPAVAALLAWLILHEPLNGQQAVGGIIILGGITIASRSRT